jgi:SAM-dependent methyltransferase
MDCKICRSKSTKFLFQTSEIDFKLPGNFNIHGCEICGYIFVSNPPEDLNFYYPTDYGPYKTAIQDEKKPLIRWARFRNVRLKEKTLNQYKTSELENLILDIGCSTGIFLDQMKRSGWGTYGIELNPIAADYARNRFGLQVETGQLTEETWKETQFGVITLWDVLEHTLDPRATLLICNKKLRIFGYVIFSVPNYESVDRLLFKKKWIGYDFPRHLSVFPIKSIQTLLDNTGFSIVKLSCRFGGYYNFLSSLNRWLLTSKMPAKFQKLILRFSYFPGVRYVFEPIFWLLDLIGIGNNRLIIAQKKEEVS